MQETMDACREVLANTTGTVCHSNTVITMLISRHSFVQYYVEFCQSRVTDDAAGGSLNCFDRQFLAVVQGIVDAEGRKKKFDAQPFILEVLKEIKAETERCRDVDTHYYTGRHNDSTR